MHIYIYIYTHDVMVRYVMLCYGMVCYAMLRYVLLCYVMLLCLKRGGREGEGRPESVKGHMPRLREKAFECWKVAPLHDSYQRLIHDFGRGNVEASFERRRRVAPLTAPTDGL